MTPAAAELRPHSLTPEQLRDRVLYDDGDVLILDKPAGLAVHYGTKCTDHLELYLPWLAGPGEDPPRLAHRLDKDTSGCLVLARTVRAAAILGRMFLQRRVEKTYWAVTETAPVADAGDVDAPLLKVKVPGMSKVIVTPEGKPAVTGWRVLGRADGPGRAGALLELTPRTGRMHQIRAHLAHLGHPVRGDRIYGPDPAPTGRLMLHARAVRLPPLDGTGPWITATAHTGADFAGWCTSAPAPHSPHCRTRPDIAAAHSAGSPGSVPPH